MKTITDKKTKTGLLSRPEPRNTDTAKQRQIAQGQIDFRRRAANRSLETAKLLALMESETPKFFEMAEVVGQWVWIAFEQRQPVTVTRVLAELGFHWNNVRKVLQHPCGMYRDLAATYDPLQRYGSYFAARTKAA